MRKRIESVFISLDNDIAEHTGFYRQLSVGVGIEKQRFESGWMMLTFCHHIFYSKANR